MSNLKITSEKGSIIDFDTDTMSEIVIKIGDELLKITIIKLTAKIPEELNGLRPK